MSRVWWYHNTAKFSGTTILDLFIVLHLRRLYGFIMPTIRKHTNCINHARFIRALYWVCYKKVFPLGIWWYQVLPLSLKINSQRQSNTRRHSKIRNLCAETMTRGEIETLPILCREISYSVLEC